MSPPDSDDAGKPDVPRRPSGKFSPELMRMLAEARPEDIAQATLTASRLLAIRARRKAAEGQKLPPSEKAAPGDT